MFLKALLLAAAVLPGQTMKRWEEPFTVLPAPSDVGAFDQKLGSESSTAYLEGDVLTILHRNKKDDVLVMGGVSRPMIRIPNSDLYILQLKMPNWDEAMISYGFYVPTDPKIDMKSIKVFRGKNGPQPAEKADSLKGSVSKHTIESKALGEPKQVTVYLPPNAPKSNLPAIYMGDGQGAEGFAKVIEPLILSGKIKPIAIIGAHAGEYQGDRTKGYDPKLDRRGLEYIYLDNSPWFPKHMEFFTQELPKWATEKFGISAKREDRAVFGFSNSGSFAAAAGLLHPDVFGHVLPFSMGVPYEMKKSDRPLPKFHFVAGKLESYHLRTQQQYDLVKGWGADAEIELFVGGHDVYLWEMGLARVVQRIFKG